MLDNVAKLLQEIKEIAERDSEPFRIKYLGQKGLIKGLFAEFKNVPAEQKKEFGQKLNELKVAAESKLKQLQARKQIEEKDDFDEDLTKPGEPFPVGSRHPISIMRNEIIDIFSRMGFTIAEGPEIEDDWHNFTALNFPEEHPARDMQDTFFIEGKDIALRTHTSSVQIREMEKNDPPIRIVCPGRVYRNEAISARSHCFFHQVEGLYVDENVSFADMKQTLFHFAKETP